MCDKQRGIDVGMNRKSVKDESTLWFLTIVALSLILATILATWIESAGALAMPTIAAKWWPILAPAQVGENAATEQSEDRLPVERGMGKEAVRQVWGAPEEVRKIRTCFGWQEEWVYRGDVKRFGGAERVLLFDEGEVLTEIK